MREDLNQNPNFYKLSAGDVILIAVVLIFSVAGIVWLNGTHASPLGPAVALIYQENKLLEKISLEKDRLVSILNGRMQLEVKNRKIRVAMADCPQHICMHTGWIQRSGQTIVCTPNKVIIEIESKGSPLVDATAL